MSGNGTHKCGIVGNRRKRKCGIGMCDKCEELKKEIERLRDKSRNSYYKGLNDGFERGCGYVQMKFKELMGFELDDRE